MESKRIAFTKVRIDRLPRPESGRPIVYDSHTPGFAVRLTPNGVRTFVLYRKIGGRPQIITIGRFPTISVKQARQIAEEMNGAIAHGDNPQEVKREKREELTLGDLFDDYKKKHGQVHLRPVTLKEYEGLYDRSLKPWANRKLSEITRRDVQNLHMQTGRNRGPYSANRLLALVHLLFNQAGYRESDNPAKGVRRFHEVKRKRFLQPDELPLLFQAMNADPDSAIRDYVLLSLLTGARKGNVLTAKWVEIDLDAATWTIPGDKAKGHEPMEIPLHEEAVTLLEARKELVGDSPFVFPGPGKHGHIINVQKPWKRILKRAGIADLRLHDLRRSLGSWQAARGASLTVIGKSLGHRNVTTTAIYSRLNLDPVRESVNGAVNDMLAAGRVKEPAKVVEFKSRG